MKVNFTTSLEHLFNDIVNIAGKVIETADRRAGGYFNITVETLKHPKTGRQLRTFWALLNAMWDTGEVSADSKKAFYHDICLRCMDADHYIYITGQGRGIMVDSMDSIPRDKLFVPIPKGISDATIEEATAGVQELLRILYETGMSSEKLDKILKGMEENRRY